MDGDMDVAGKLYQQETQNWQSLLHPSLGQNLKSLIPQNALIDCRMGSNPFGPPMSLDHMQIHVEAHTYLKPQASDELSYSLGRFLDLDPSYISLNGGSTHSMSTLLSRFLKPTNKKMLGLSPQYTHAVCEWIYFGGHYESIPLMAHNQTPENIVQTLIDTLKTTSPDVLFLDNPNNPTGYFFEINEIFDIVSTCKERGIFCIIDEAYIDYISQEHSAIYLVQEFEHLIVTRSFSKGMGMAALRIGYTIAQPEISKIIKQLTLPYSIATPSLYIAQHILDTIDMKQYLKQSALFAAHSKHELIQACTRAGFHIANTHPNVPLFCVFHSRTCPCEYFQKLQVITTPGAKFNLGNKETPFFARVRVPESDRELHQLCQRISDNPIHSYN